MTEHRPPGPEGPGRYRPGEPGSTAPVPRQRRAPGAATGRGRALDKEIPDRLYTITGGRAHAGTDAFDTVTLIVAEGDPRPGMQSEHVRILRMARRPVAVVEISARLALPVSVVKILLCDLLDSGRITARHPVAARASVPDIATLEQVLIGLRNL